MDITPNLRLPFILEAQAQKHVTHNEAIRALDALVQIAVLDRDLTAPPLAPDDGDRYIAAAGATGDWSGKETEIAAWQDGAWAFYSPQPGWLAWIEDEASLLVFDGAAWAPATAVSGGASLNPATGGLVGINATADATNRLAVASAASLFNHAGTGGHQQKINKAIATDTASVLYQTGFSGRAEMGTTGDDDFHFKVSPDGSTWHEAILIDKDTGTVTFPNTTIGGGGGAYRGALVQLSASESIPNNTFTVVPWDAEAYDTDAIWSAGNPSRLTVPSGVTKIQILGHCAWNSNATGGRAARLSKNGNSMTEYSAFANDSANASGVHGAPVLGPIIEVTGGDYFEIEVFQSSGGNLDLQGPHRGTWAMMIIWE
ncbi:MAG: DUF2793 domain-containing protein [Rhizobiales bacterium]|nr:DUF2793 domain-containing protein [Hyphomicrobiales bacterium]